MHLYFDKPMLLIMFNMFFDVQHFTVDCARWCSRIGAPQSWFCWVHIHKPHGVSRATQVLKPTSIATKETGSIGPMWGFPARHGATPKWLLDFMENPQSKMDDDWGYPPWRNGNLHVALRDQLMLGPFRISLVIQLLPPCHLGSSSGWDH